ncbi:HPP family protein [Polynucleobacter sp. Adler-ghost]|uniref:HPP family protein n=1 Tax=Polynucleobacter sp. Adler-ghost TaxID=2770234 RepID=UPI001BFECF5E|nr:HPP family protein [Polynucleobacter sp. Adler-ghost]QWE31025.1 HPP family protein [Polynucleobacter sp. Adler-ghost]
MSRIAMRLIKYYSFYFGGDQTPMTWTERFRSSFDVFIGLLLVITIAKYLGELSGIDEWLIASLGASALLVFVLPNNPMAQPWAVIAGNTLSALVGISTANLIYEPLLAIPIATSYSVLACLCCAVCTPPAAAVSLITALGHVMHYRYAVFQVMIDSVLLVLAALLYSNAGKSYLKRPPRQS